VNKMQKIKYINLGEEFKIKKGLQCEYLKEFKSLFECYDRPSQAKENIYNYYLKLLYNNCDDVLVYGVRSYNTFTITLHAKIKKDNKLYYVLITPSYNYIEQIQEGC